MMYYSKLLPLLPEDHPYMTTIYMNSGHIFEMKNDNKTALVYYFKTIELNKDNTSWAIHVTFKMG